MFNSPALGRLNNNKMNDDFHDISPSFLQMGNSLIEAELSQTITSETVSLETFQTVLSDKKKVNTMLDLVEKSILYFVPKESDITNYIWGLDQPQFLMIERRIQEVFNRSYNEFVPVFSFMSISVSTTAEVTNLLADGIENQNNIFKKKNQNKIQQLRNQGKHLERLALVLRALYLNHARLKQADWVKVEDDLNYIKSADQYIRQNKPEFIENESKNLNLDGILWLNRQLKKRYKHQYHHFNDDFPFIAEAWTMGAITVKQSEHLPEIQKLPKEVQKKVKRYAQLSNTLMALNKVELEIRLSDASS